MAEQPPSVRLDIAGRELFLDLSEQPGRTLRAKLLAALKQAIREGRLVAETVLPSSRTLAADLGVSRGVVVNVYAQLSAEGFLLTRPGGRSVVTAAGRRDSSHDMAEVEQPNGRTDNSGIIDLRPGPPDLGAFPRTAWMTATRDVLRSVESSQLGYVTPWGSWVFRAEVADYLSRVRGAMATPQSLVAVSGVTQGLTLMARVLRGLGLGELAVESPSHAVQRQILSGHGLRIIDVPVDPEGIDVGALRRTDARAALVTPAHQYPTGVMMSPARRRALIRWAEEKNGLVIEDDFDAEFRYERLSVGCLQGLAPERVVLLGSVSKSLAPALRLGWAVAPQLVRTGLMSAKRDDDFGGSGLEQQVVAHLLMAGTYEAHVRKLRRHYHVRREALSSALAEKLPDWTVNVQKAGLHLMVRPAADTVEDALVEAAANHGVLVQGMREMYGSVPPEPGILISFARAPGGLLAEAVDRLAAAAHTSEAKQARQVRAPGATVTPPAAVAADYG